MFVLTADCGYNNTCIAYDYGSYCEFPEMPGDFCNTSGTQFGHVNGWHAHIKRDP